MIIREGQLSLEVESILEAMDAARAVVEGVGGRVDGSHIVGADLDSKYGSVTLRVPSSSFDAVVGELRTLGRLLSESSSSADVTEEYVDLEARRGNLEETEQKLQAFLDQAEDVEDLLAVQRELTTTRGEIERLIGRINLLSALVSESTIGVEFFEPGAEPPITGDGWRPGETLEDAARWLLTVLRVGWRPGDRRCCVLAGDRGADRGRVADQASVAAFRVAPPRLGVGYGGGVVYA